jgi:hypothetical protein
VQADNFSGFYVDAGLGINNTAINMKTDAFENITPTLPTGFETLNGPVQNHSSTSSNAGIKLTGGWGQVIEHEYYVGGFVSVQSNSFDKNEKTSTGGLITTATDDAIGFVINNAVQLKQITPLYTLGIKFGVLLSPKTLLWGKVGYSQMSVKSSAQSSFSYEELVFGEPDINGSLSVSSGSKKTTLAAPSFAVGVEQKFTKHWNGFISDTLTTFGKVKFNHKQVVNVHEDITGEPSTDTLGTTQMDNSYSLATQTFMVGATYRF